jgi:hypothetical protein
MDLAREVHQRWPRVLLVITSGQKKPTEGEIPDHGLFVAKPYRAEELLGQLDDMIHNSSRAAVSQKPLPTSKHGYSALKAAAITPK